MLARMTSPESRMEERTFYEFFAGGGMVRAGLGQGWRCLFANDFDPKKAATYRANYGDAELVVGDVRKLETQQLPACADLVWASFPCQDLSLAGAGRGLAGARSGTFWPFFDLVKRLNADGRGPKIVALENVCGLLTSHKGADFTALCEALAKEGYRFGALVVDAALFVPQSRPRLFVIAVRGEAKPPAALTQSDGAAPFHARALVEAVDRLPPAVRARWLWWRLPAPAVRNLPLSALVEAAPADVSWHGVEETQALIAKMRPHQLARVEAARRSGGHMAGAAYRRTRTEKGAKIQRVEARFDDLAGCLRTPAGGSSRQFLLIVEKGELRSRLLSARETARLMGLSDDYALPGRYNDAYHLTGDGVVVPVVRHIAAHVFEPLLAALEARRAAA
jgi:DNA (cytosine-5)-methyltransferase 1